MHLFFALNAFVFASLVDGSKSGDAIDWVKAVTDIFQSLQGDCVHKRRATGLVQVVIVFPEINPYLMPYFQINDISRLFPEKTLTA